MATPRTKSSGGETSGDRAGIFGTASGETQAPAWRRRLIERSLGETARRSLDRGFELVFAAATLLESSQGDNFTVQDIADTAKQSLRTLYVHFEGKDDLLLAVFEEAMQAYARVITEAIATFDDPLERLAAAVYFSHRFAERTTPGVSIGIAKLRTKLMNVAPEQVAWAEVPRAALFARLVRAAADAGQIKVESADAATFLILCLLDSLGLNRTLGNEYGLEMPGANQLVEFSLHGLQGALPAGWQDRFEECWERLPRLYSVAESLRERP